MRTTTAARTLAPSKANFFHWRTNILSSDLQRKHKYYFLASGTYHCFLCQSVVYLYTIAIFFLFNSTARLFHTFGSSRCLFEKYGVTFFSSYFTSNLNSFFPRRKKKKCRFFFLGKKKSLRLSHQFSRTLRYLKSEDLYRIFIFSQD